MGAYEYLASVMPDGSPLAGREYPHCDWHVLHAPGACQYCDGHPDWQAERMSGNLLFTGDIRNHTLIEEMLATGVTHIDGLRPRPAQFARGNNCQIWGGNKPRPACDEEIKGP